MNKIKLLLTEWNERKLPELTTREFNYNQLKLNKIISFVGVRRSGKTYYLYQIIKHLLKTGIKKEQIIYINFEDNRLFPLEGDELDQIIPTQIELFEKEEQYYIFLDEIQNIPYWSKWLRRLNETTNHKIFVTGSSAKLLSREIATELAGRTISNEVYPLKFNEYLKFKNINIPENLEFSNDLPIIKNNLNNYIENGGFPEIVISEENKEIILKSYYDSIFYKDLIERHNIKSFALFKDFINLIANNFSSPTSLTKYENLLKSLGHKVSKSTLSNYMSYLEESFFAFTVPIFSNKIKDRLQYPKKIYLIDNGIVNLISAKSSKDTGKKLENIIYLNLKEKNLDIFYFRSKKDTECDFIVKDEKQNLTLIQVTENFKDSKEREINSLLDAMKETNLKTGIIISYDTKEEIKVKNKTIKVIPVYEWLLKQ